jgi:succinate dehydrogenase cytochrome b subunit
MAKQASFAQWEPEAVFVRSRDRSVPATLVDCGRDGHRLPTASSSSGKAIMAEARTSQARDNRPLSPHLQIYKPMLTMMMSIAHRITGAALYFAMLLMVWWLMAASSGPGAYARVQWFMGSWIGRLVLFGCTWALMHHLFGGIRHLIWDIGYGLGPSEREWLTRATLIGAIVVTVLLWAFGYLVMGLA